MNGRQGTKETKEQIIRCRWRLKRTAHCSAASNLCRCFCLSSCTERCKSRQRLHPLLLILLPLLSPQHLPRRPHCPTAQLSDQQTISAQSLHQHLPVRRLLQLVMHLQSLHQHMLVRQSCSQLHRHSPHRRMHSHRKQTSGL